MKRLGDDDLALESLPLANKDALTCRSVPEYLGSVRSRDQSPGTGPDLARGTRGAGFEQIPPALASRSQPTQAEAATELTKYF